MQVGAWREAEALQDSVSILTKQPGAVAVQQCLNALWPVCVHDLSREYLNECCLPAIASGNDSFLVSSPGV